jgi:putative cell wall-binding protein
VLLSQERFDDGEADAAVIVRPEGFTDALAAVPLADARNATLLVAGKTLDRSVRREIGRAVDARGRIYIVGGTGAVSPGVAAALRRTGRPVVRVTGGNRYDTAVNVARLVRWPRTVVLANGRRFADALVAGSLAASTDGVLLLTDGARLPSSARTYLAQHRGIRTIAVGGPAARAVPRATPVVGTNVYDTAVRVAKRFYPRPTGVAVASGTVLGDGLTGGLDAAAQHRPVLLTRPEALPVVTRQYLASTRSVVAADVHGGRVSVRQAVLATLRRLLAR